VVFGHSENEMSIKGLIKRNRSHRRFFEHIPVKRKILERLVDLARFSASALNKQPLKYFLSYHKDSNDLIFSNIIWAGGDWVGPIDGERPPAYIIILMDKEISRYCDCEAGIAAQNILLGATEIKLGGCILGPVNREELRKSLEIKEKFGILFILAIGKPKKEVILEKASKNGNLIYWQDKQGNFHVPKRNLKDIIIN